MIGTIIQQKRKEAGFTQAQLAERLGVTAPAVNRWEKDLSFPDATLLAPLARCLGTDLNGLFSFYDSLSDKERELIDEKLHSMILTESEEDILGYVDSVLQQNLADGQLYLQVAKTLYGGHILKKAYAPKIYLSEILKCYERALELCPDAEQEICETLMSIYASLGDADRASAYWSRLRRSKLELMQAHADMLFLLKDYPAAAAEQAELILHKVVALSVDLGLLHDILMACGDTDLAHVAKQKAASIRQEFELWEGFDVLSLVSTAVSSLDDENYSKYLSELITLKPNGTRISSSPLFEKVNLGAAGQDKGTIADQMADMMAALSKLHKNG